MKIHYTPGPWEIKSVGNYYSVKGTQTPHKFQVCKVSPGICGCAPGQQHGAANARLIAAAPELLEALESIIVYAENEAESLSEVEARDGQSCGANEAWESIEAAREVINKATKL